MSTRINTQVWIPDKEHEWILADIVSEDNDTVSASVSSESTRKALQNSKSLESSFKNILTSSPITFKHSDVCEFDSSHLEDLNDLCEMNNLHEAPLIHILRRRWFDDKIYTCASDVLISVNPYKVIPGLYNNPLDYYRPADDADQDGDTAFDTEKPAPHAYNVANTAFKRLVIQSNNLDSAGKANQSVIVSGESGAGKTEASKHVINFLISVNQHLTSSAEESVLILTNRIKDVILDSSVVFEAFGNAKTVRNDNSSRFGKYIKLQYSEDNGLISATTETFLLEKSRLVSVGAGERNYHVFYQLLRGIDKFDSSIKKSLMLGSVDDYKILTSGSCTVVHSEEDDSNEFNNLINALKSLGIKSDDLSGLWTMLAAVLHLGNATFDEPVDHELAKIHISTATADHVAELLGVPTLDFLRALTAQSIAIAKRSSVKSKTLTATESSNNVNALIKWIYSNIFSWLLHSINECHGSLVTQSRPPVKFLGILDIFGFEILGTNSFEQLCINFTNERLQQQFNDRIFASEQELYIKERINWTSISYQDNQNVIDLISKKPTGILYILEEHCALNRTPDDMALLGQINNIQGDRPDKIYIKSRFVKDTVFTIKHFAGGVTYRIDNFISKNNDALQDDLTELIQTTTNSFLKKVFVTNNPSIENKEQSTTQTRGAQRKAFASSITVSLQFRNQLDTLITTLRATEPHYIKCIKPNDVKASGVFQAALTMTQLRYSGILEVVRIRREGFPVRIKYSDFYLNYEIFSRLKRGVWARPGTCSEDEARKYCEIITNEYLPRDAYQFGSTLLFIREYGLNLMLHAVNKYASVYSTRIQKEIRRFLGVKHYRIAKKSILHLQCHLRIFISKCKLVKLKTAKRLYEEELERQRLAELARQEAERKRLEEERRRKEEERRKLEEEKRRADEALRLEQLEREKAAEALKRAAEAEEFARRQAYEARQNLVNNARLLIRKKVGALYRNAKLRRRIDSLFRQCESGELSKSVLLPDFKIRWYRHAFDTPLRVAIKNERSKIIESLRSTVPSDRFGVKRNSLLHVAASTCSEKIFRQVLKDVEAPAKAGVRPSFNIAPIKISPDYEISSGWMMKYRPGQRKIRRWCVLKPHKILYFKTPDEKIPRAVIDIDEGTPVVRVDTEPYAFEIESSSLPARRNMFGTPVKKSMVFVAESEIMATDWIFHITHCQGVTSIPRSISIDYISPTILRDILSVRNIDNETCLHAIIKSKKLTPSSADSIEEASAMALADWLIANGVSLGVKDSSGLTVSDFAVAMGYENWVQYFAAKEKSLANLAISEVSGGDLSDTRYANVGYTYINIYIYRQYIKDSKGKLPTDQKSFAVSIRNSNGDLVEIPRTIRYPIFKSKLQILWGSVVKIRTPINVVPKGSYLQFDQVASVLAVGNAEVTYKLEIKPEAIQSGFYEIQASSPGHSTLVVEVSLSPY